MSATVVRKKNQTTLPAEVLAQANIRPKDQVDWRFEDGEIRGRKLVAVDDVVEEILDVDDVDPHTLAPRKRGKICNDSISRAIRADRDDR